MGILSRFADIISANVNALIDKAEDPAKMVDQYIRKMMTELAQVKRETASIMAEETRTKRLVEENEKEVLKYEGCAKKALLVQNEDDARVFISKKQELEAEGAGYKLAYAVAHENAIKMRQMHDKLAKDINALNIRRKSIKAKSIAAKAIERVNDLGVSVNTRQGTIGAFERMEDSANRRFDEASALAELNSEPIDAAQALADKYKLNDINDSISDELAAMKAQLGIN